MSPRRLLRRPPTPAAVTFLAAMVVAGLVTHWFGTEAGLIALILGLLGPVLVPQIYGSLPAPGDQSGDGTPPGAHDPIPQPAVIDPAATAVDVPGPEEFITGLAIALLRLSEPGTPIVPPAPRHGATETTPAGLAEVTAVPEPLAPEGETR